MDSTPFDRGLEFLRDYIDRMDHHRRTTDKLILEESYRYLLANSLSSITRIGDYFPDGIIIFAADGEILYVNQANAEMFGIPWEECVGCKAQDFAGECLWINNATTIEVFEHKKAYTSITVPKRTGRQLLEIGVPLMDKDGNLEGVLVIDKDISQIEQIRDVLETTQYQMAQMEEVQHIQEEIIQVLSNQSRNQGEYVYDSDQMRAVVAEAIHVARSDATVLIQGETGCGKEILADIIQSSSERADKPYIKVNCAALPEQLLESELFGYERGAFTGADPKGKAGMFELANGGTLLLDEIGEIPMAFQAKLLRALQNRQIIRVGGTKAIGLNIRIIASTNRDLKAMVEQGTFREDLYYRIHVLPVYIPPLRERPEDVEVLVRYYLKRFNQKYGKSIMLDPLVYFKLKRYDWPGNIRELENMVERWVVIYEPYTVIRWEQVEHAFNHHHSGYGGVAEPVFYRRTMSEIMDDYQREVLEWAKKEYGTVREMAAAMDVDHSTIVKKAKRLGVSLEREKRDQT